MTEPPENGKAPAATKQRGTSNSTNNYPQSITGCHSCKLGFGFLALLLPQTEPKGAGLQLGQIAPKERLGTDVLQLLIFAPKGAVLQLAQIAPKEDSGINVLQVAQNAPKGHKVRKKTPKNTLKFSHLLRGEHYPRKHDT
jgi:hypothetical protein